MGKISKNPIVSEADTMENYILKLIDRCEEKINDNESTFATFQYYTGAKDFLYMILSGYVNPLANPKK